MKRALNVVGGNGEKSSPPEDKYLFIFLLSGQLEADAITCEGAVLVEQEDYFDIFSRKGDKMPAMRINRDVFMAMRTRKL